MVAVCMHSILVIHFTSSFWIQVGAVYMQSHFYSIFTVLFLVFATSIFDRWCRQSYLAAKKWQHCYMRDMQSSKVAGWSVPFQSLLGIGPLSFVLVVVTLYFEVAPFWVCLDPVVVRIGIPLDEPQSILMAMTMWWIACTLHKLEVFCVFLAVHEVPRRNLQALSQYRYMCLENCHYTSCKYIIVRPWPIELLWLVPSSLECTPLMQILHLTALCIMVS